MEFEKNEQVFFINSIYIFDSPKRKPLKALNQFIQSYNSLFYNLACIFKLLKFVIFPTEDIANINEKDYQNTTTN